jgi:hypothetical protein
LLHLGEGGRSLPELSFQAYSRLVESARDAKSVAAATADGEAEARAVYWLGLLAEHGAVCGWGGEDELDPEEDAAGVDARVDDPAGSAYAACGDVAGDDGNLDTCATCGFGGLLICCEACPNAFHAACLGDCAPPEDDDEDADWFCPTCAVKLGMA